MSKIEIKVFALPTEKAIEIGSIIQIQDNVYGRTHEGDVDYNNLIIRKRNCSIAIKDPKKVSYWNYNRLHLYATTSETPKEEEYYIYPHLINDGVWKCGKDGVPNSGARKVVATTDKDLVIETPLDAYYRDGVGIQKRLPQISPEFQQAWVREANKGTPIVDAMMEMEEIKQFVSETKKHTSNGTEYTEAEWEFQNKPKLNPQGYVTILPVKEKMYPLDALKESFKGARRLLPSNDEESDFNKWLKMYETVNL